MSGDFWRRLRLPWLARRDVEREFEDELEFHIEMRSRELTESGVDPDEARRRAVAHFGDVEETRRGYVRRRSRRLRRSRSAMRFDDLGQDLRAGVRQLRRYPGFALVVVLTLALGIGANTAAFSVISGVLLKPLPYPDSDRVVRVWGTIPERGEMRNNLSPRDLLDMAEQSSTIAALAAFSPGAATVTGRGDAEHVREVRVLPSVFAVLGVGPVLGRGFTAEEAVDGGAPAVILSHGYWQRAFASDPGVVGTILGVDDAPHTVVGVLPAGLPFPTLEAADQPQILRPLVLGPEHGRGGHWLRAVGRLAPDATVEAADTDIRAISERLAEAYPQSNRLWRARVESLKEATIGRSASGLWVLQGAVLLVLLIACANVANLMVVRGSGRAMELAVRRALGAGRGRLVRQLLAENLVLATLGGAGGLLLAGWATTILVAMPGSGVPRVDEVSIDGAVLGFCALTAIATGLLASLAPLRDALTSGVRAGLGGEAAGGGSAGRLRGTLVSAEAALALVLLVGAGLLLRSFARLSGEEAGVDTRHATVIEVLLPATRYASEPEIEAFYRDWIASVAELSGVRAAGAVNNLPFFYESCDGFRLPDRPDPAPGEGQCASNQLVTPGYFEAAGIPILEGRGFTAEDRSDSRPVAVVSRSFAERYWPGASAVGEQVSYNGIAREIVGVSEAVRRLGLAREAPPEMFIAHAQDPWETQMFIVVRTDDDDAGIVERVRASLRAADPGVPIGRVMPLRRLVSDTVAEPRFRTVALAAFAALALLLAGIGLYGVMAHSVERRSRELAVRVALGADHGRVLRLVMRDGLGLTGVGLAVGAVGAVLGSRVLEGLLYETEALDPVSLATAAALLLGVSLCGSFLPARRATRADPLAALKQE